MYISLQALMRPGRFDRVLYVPLPDTATRQRIFSIHIRHMPVSPTISTHTLADKTPGYSGAEVRG